MVKETICTKCKMSVRFIKHPESSRSYTSSTSINKSGSNSTLSMECPHCGTMILIKGLSNEIEDKHKC